MMKAVRFHDYGTAEVLCYEDAPTPESGPRDVLVCVHAAGGDADDGILRDEFPAKRGRNKAETLQARRG